MDLYSGLSRHRMVLNIVGVLLLLAGVVLAATTERRLVDYRGVANEHGGEAIDFGTVAQPRAGQHGYMGRVVATPRVVEAPHDQQFNLTVNTTALTRHVEMFQWREIDIGGNVHYELDWVDHLVDASRFKHPARHANPAEMPIHGKRFNAGLVQVGGFKLGAKLQQALPGSRPVEPGRAKLPDNLAATFSEYDGHLVSSSNPAAPRLGDLRISWSAVPLQLTTVVGRIDGSRLVAAANADDGKGFQVKVGDVSLLAIFPDLPIPPKFVLIQRLLALLLAAAGVFLLLLAQREQRRDELLALGAGALAVGVVAGICWLGAAALPLCAWLVVALLGLALAIWRLRQRPWRPGRA